MVNVQGPWSPLLGRLSLGAIPNNPIILGAFIFSAVLGVLLVGYVTYADKWGVLWREWFTTVDHKKIGVMYIVIGLVMLFRGFIDALMMRTQQMLADGPHSPGFLGAAHGYLVPYHFDQIYSAHGTIMILFAATPILVGLMNVIVPIQIGARDMAFPYLNAVGLWLTAVGAALIMISLFLGDFSHAGWVGLTPLTELAYSPGVGTDYWMWAIQISSVGTTLGAANLIATIVKMRAPGMTWSKLPIFTWTALSTNIIALTSFPVLAVALGLLGVDRYFGTHFFTAGLGGNLMLYSDLFWIWGHPEVYFVILPAFGMMSEIIPTFAEKALFGYVTMVAASFAIAGVSWSVWLHHFFTMGAGPRVNTFFSIATMVVGIPTGVKVFNWAFTIFRGRSRFETPMMWAIGALFMLLLGGLTGMMLAMPPINYSVHNSVFVVAHFHTMLMVVVYGIMGAVSYWFPKVFGFKLNERLGKRFFWYFTAGTIMVFIPMYTSGFMGMTRRLDYLANPALMPFEVAEEVGIGLYLISIVYFVLQLYVSIRDRVANRVGADAWGTGRTLEWLTPSPVPFYNFALTPRVHARDELVWRREQGLEGAALPGYEDILLPRNTPVPLLIGALALALGFGLVWRIWWLTDVSLLAIVLTVIARSFVQDTDMVVKASEVEKIEQLLRARGAGAASAEGGRGVEILRPSASRP